MLRKFNCLVLFTFHTTLKLYEMEVCHAISLSSLILFVLSYCKQWGHGDKANSSIFIKCYCHLAVGIISKMQLLTKTKQKLFTQFSWPEVDTRGTVDC